MRALLLASALAACTPSDPVPAVPAEPSERAVPEGFAGPVLVDTTRVRSADDAASWAYRRTTEADLDRDGSPERVVLASDVTLGPDGEPAWEDGHRWAVYVEEPDSARTLLYAAFVPLGQVDAGVVGPDASPRVLVLERGPHQARAVEVAYGGPGVTRFVAGAGGSVGSWVEKAQRADR